MTCFLSLHFNKGTLGIKRASGAYVIHRWRKRRLQPASEIIESKLCCLTLGPRWGQASLVTTDMAAPVFHPPLPYCPIRRGFSRVRGWGVAVLVPPYDKSLLEKHLFCFLGSNQQYSYTCMRGSSTPISLLPSIFILAHLPCVLENTDAYIHNSSAAKLHTSSPLQDFPLKAESQCLPLGWAEDLVRSQARGLFAE